MPTAVNRSEIADRSLAEAGQGRIDWAESEMPVLRSIRGRFEREKPLRGVTVAACLHVTAETANLITTLLAGGAEVGLCAANPLSTQDDVAAALVEHSGAEVHARSGETTDTYYKHIAALMNSLPQITMDDGADLVSFVHGNRLALAENIIGGTEETTTGVIRLKALEAEGKLAFGVIAVNDAQTKHLFDNRYGTGQSTLDGILRATNVLLAGRTIVVFGYGWCGKGVAIRASGAGASVVVCEVDPIRALEARMDGFSVMPGVEAARVGDVFITVTGGRDVIDSAHFEVMKDGAIICNSGHFNVEINVSSLEAIAVDHCDPRPRVREFRLSDGRRLNLLSEGRVVNLANAEGHPPAVMDMSFANQALAVEYIARNDGPLEKRVHPVPAEFDQEIARLKLESLGIQIDELTDSQREYLSSWEHGT